MSRLSTASTNAAISSATFAARASSSATLTQANFDGSHLNSFGVARYARMTKTGDRHRFAVAPWRYGPSGLSVSSLPAALTGATGREKTLPSVKAMDRTVSIRWHPRREISTDPASCRCPLGEPALRLRAVVRLLKSLARREERREERREVRVQVGWHARYRLDSHGPWLTCRVIDLSVDGAALELPEDAPSPTSRLILLDVQCGETPPGDVVLRADVRSLCFAPNGRHRIGVMFVNVNSVEREFLSGVIKRNS